MVKIPPRILRVVLPESVFRKSVANCYIESTSNSSRADLLNLGMTWFFKYDSRCRTVEAQRFGAIACRHLSAASANVCPAITGLTLPRNWLICSMMRACSRRAVRSLIWLRFPDRQVVSPHQAREGICTMNGMISDQKLCWGRPSKNRPP